MKVAAIDMGTNTFLCLILEKSGSRMVVLKDLHRTVRLGEGVAQYRKFQPSALQRAQVCLETFKSEIEKEGVDKVAAVATAAARDVENSREIFDICDRLEIPLEIIEGVREAELTYQGACFDLPHFEGQQMVVDIGGGSTELILGEGRVIREAHSLNIGGVKVSEQTALQHPLDNETVKKIDQLINKQLDTLSGFWTNRVEQIITVAGTPTSLAAAELGAFVEKEIQGYRIGLESLERWRKKLASMTVQEIRDQYQMGGRADIIYAGTSILWNILKRTNRQEIIVSTKGVRYGLALQLIS